MRREQTTIRLPNELLEQLKKQAELKGYPLKDLLMFIFNDYLSRESSKVSNDSSQ